jgi:hypothetical protein
MLASGMYRIVKRILRKRVVAKMMIETAYAYALCDFLLASFNRDGANLFEGRIVGGFKRRKVQTAPLHCAELVIGDETGAGGEPMFAATNRPPWIE